MLDGNRNRIGGVVHRQKRLHLERPDLKALRGRVILDLFLATEQRGTSEMCLFREIERDAEAAGEDAHAARVIAVVV